MALSVNSWHFLLILSLPWRMPSTQPGSRGPAKHPAGATYGTTNTVYGTTNADAGVGIGLKRGIQKFD